MVMSTYPLALFLSDWWHMKRVRNNIYNQRLYTVGDGMAVFWCILSAAWALGKVFLVSDEASRQSTQVCEILQSLGKAEDQPVEFDYDSMAKHVVFENVSCEKDGHPLLTKVSFCISEGEKVAILATRLCPGEDLIIDLLAGRATINDGAITFNGAPASNLDRSLLLQRIGILRKRQTLFNMTIKEYLMLGVSPNAYVNEETIKIALKTSMAADFIERFPDEENTEMGRQGSTLSLSQRIRVQLASFLVARPRPKLLLIEDVASCINDYKARIKVQKAIHAVLSKMEDTTVVIVTDHPLTLQTASRVIVL